MNRMIPIAVIPVLPVLLLFLHCDIPDSPSDPKKTGIMIIFKTADSRTHNNSVTDTAGRPLEIGAVLHLPENFDSISLVVKEEDSMVINRTFTQFNNDDLFDTVWYSYTFSAPGVKNLILTPYSFPKLQPISSNISIIQGPNKPSAITFLKNSSAASGTMPILNYTKGDSVRLPENIFINPGYRFNGWATAETGEVEFMDKAEFRMGPENMTLYAVWVEEAAFTITFNKNHDSAQGVMNQQTIISGGTVALDENEFTCTGWTFAGWATSAAGEVTYTDKAEYIMDTGDDTLYAIWTQEPLYRIIFNGNGGSGSMADQSIASGMSVSLFSNTYEREGFEFSGWNTDPDGSGVPYADRASFSMDTTDVTLYAIWTITRHTVTFNSQGGSDVPSETINHGGLVTKPEPPTYANHSFGGWFEEPGCDNAWDFATMTVSDDIVLFAKWTEKETFTLSISATDGSVTKVPDLPVYESGTVVKLTPVPAEGFHFSGWSGALTGMTNPGKITMDEAKSVTANFEKNDENSYALTVLATNGTVRKTPDLPQYDSGSTVGLKASPAAGYRFVKWTGDATGTVDSIIVQMSRARSISANFAIITYALSINVENGTVSKTPDTAQYDSGTVVSLKAIPSPGYQFTRWEGDLTGTMNPASITMDGTKSVTANFALKTYALTIAATNGTVAKSPDAVQYDSGTVVRLTPEPDPDYVFSGWSGDLTGSANPGSVTMNSAKNITANFKVSAPVITTPLQNRSCPVNDTMTFTVEASGLGLSYAWKKNGNPVGINEPSYTPPALTVADISAPATYTCIVSNAGGNDETGAMLLVDTVSDHNSNTYHQVKIGTQIWMMENLRVISLNDGTPIEEVEATDEWAEATGASYCYYDNTSDAVFINKYGALYNWFAVKSGKLAPKGWRVPSLDDLNTLKAFVTEATIVNGGKLKEAGTANWWEPNDAHNETGFTALPGSLRYSGGGWGYPYLPGGGTLGSAACFWSTEEENIDKASLMILIYSGPDISIGSIEKKCGLSVRCIKNED